MKQVLQHILNLTSVSELERHNQKLERETAVYHQKAKELKDRINSLQAARTENERVVSSLEDEEKALKAYMKL